MIYDKLPIALLALLATEDAASPNAQIARWLVTHAAQEGELTVKAVAAACHVGTGTVSRFAREAGFAGFSELREAFAEAARHFECVEGEDVEARVAAFARAAVGSVAQTAATLDRAALARLVADLHAYERVSAYGLLKAQAAAVDLQVDLLMQGKLVETCTSPVEQAERIAAAGADELVIVFSYTGSYFDAVDLGERLARADRPKVWMVSGTARRKPACVSDLLLFSSDHSQLGHPYQLEAVAGVIAQEYAAIC